MKQKIWMVIFVLLVGTFLTGLLVVVNAYTEPIIKKNKELKIKASILDAMGITCFKDEVEQKFQENIEALKKGDKIFYVSQDREIAFEISGMGLWGNISGVIAIFPDLETIKGLTIIHQEETPGLGGRIGEKEYLDSFKNKKGLPGLKVLPPGTAVNDDEVDAITGATMSSVAFVEMINSQTKKYLPLIKEK